MIVTATSSTQPNKADCSKHVFCQDHVEKLMLCVKMEDCGLNTFFLNCKQFLEMYGYFKSMVT